VLASTLPVPLMLAAPVSTKISRFVGAEQHYRDPELSTVSAAPSPAFSVTLSPVLSTKYVIVAGCRPPWRRRRAPPISVSLAPRHRSAFVGAGTPGDRVVQAVAGEASSSQAPVKVKFSTLAKLVGIRDRAPTSLIVSVWPWFHTLNHLVVQAVQHVGVVPRAPPLERVLAPRHPSACRCRCPPMITFVQGVSR